MINQLSAPVRKKERQRVITHKYTRITPLDISYSMTKSPFGNFSN